MRLIDADKLRVWVKTECNPYGKPSIDYESGKKVLDMIDRMPPISPTVNQWIKCEDELPKEAGEYLIAVEMKDGSYECDMDIFNGKKWRYTKRRDVVAWMPLPQYEGDD